jgi:hypothetical protein
MARRTMYPFEAVEARRLIRTLHDNCQRPSGLGDLVFKIETTSGREVVGHLVEQDGESSPEGVMLGGMPPNNEHTAIQYDEMTWIGVGYTE